MRLCKINGYKSIAIPLLPTNIVSITINSALTYIPLQGAATCRFNSMISIPLPIYSQSFRTTAANVFPVLLHGNKHHYRVAWLTKHNFVSAREIIDGVSVCPYVCPSHTSTESNLLNVGYCSFHCRLAQESSISRPAFTP